MQPQDNAQDVIEGEPKPIRKLDKNLINRIAAGEIIHRPASALKELIENCLDAGATSIRVTVKEGGLKLLQIQDNGCGIKKSDLPILAQRFTTYKLSTFSDLSQLTTYGFRGEALASISHVANLTVVTKTQKDSCAWKACYVDGELAPVKPGQTPDPKPFAGVDGTTITVENLFYNTPTRLSALRSSSEEYARILDVITKYSVHNAGVSFTCKKVGSSSPDLSTPASSSPQQAIRTLYGQSIAKDLLSLEVKPPAKRKGKRARVEDDDEDGVPEPDPSNEVASGSWKADVHFTSANYHSKKTIFLLFINHRLVESPRIRRAIEAVYTGILPKGSSPFVYLSLELDPATVDPNVHPTKREVHFLDEEAITERVADEVQSRLAKAGERTFEYQTLLTGGIAQPDPGKKPKGKEKTRIPDEELDASASASFTIEVPSSQTPTGSGTAKKILSQHKIRTSAADRTLDSMFPVLSQTAQMTPGDGSAPVEPSAPRKAKYIQESTCYLISVMALRKRVERGRHRQLAEILEKHTFVGVVDLRRELSLIQHATKLYLVSHGTLAEELFYQLGLRQFGNLPRLKLDPPPPLRTLVALAVAAEEDTEQSNMSKAAITEASLSPFPSPLSLPSLFPHSAHTLTRKQAIVDLLIDRRDMFSDYFSLCITEDGLVQSIPLLLPDFTPDLDKLPLFLMRIGPQVDWTGEEECFDTFLRELAYFYVPSGLPDGCEDEDGNGVGAEGDAMAKEAGRLQQEAAERWQIQHVLFPAMRRYLSPAKALLTHDVVQVANVPELYRVFERC
ncbi:hypothetical protein OF83DRAFT_1277223 [Amylostereum chailletii]|nr:hypothetical protein OF83DRAFT_1277223 [Amylostereum chailletii]